MSTKPADAEQTHLDRVQSVLIIGGSNFPTLRWFFVYMPALFPNDRPPESIADALSNVFEHSLGQHKRYLILKWLQTKLFQRVFVLSYPMIRGGIEILNADKWQFDFHVPCPTKKEMILN